MILYLVMIVLAIFIMVYMPIFDKKRFQYEERRIKLLEEILEEIKKEK